MPVTFSRLDRTALRAQFPALAQEVGGHPLVYLDNAATSQKPQYVLDALSAYYEHDNPNVHRGIHELSRRATVAFDDARVKLAKFIGAADSALHALDAATGRLRWSYPTKAWVIAPATYADGIVAVASQSSMINIVGDRTGRRQLIFDTGRGRRIAGGPVIQGDRVYFATRDGTVWAIDRTARTLPFEGTILLIKLNIHVWGLIGPPVQKGSVWSTRVGGEITRAVAVTPDSVYAGTRNGKVAALDAATGELRWVTETGFEITSSPTVAGTTVMVGTKDGKVLGLDTATGKVIWDFQTQGRITASPVVAGGTLYVASRDGTLYALTGP